MNATYKEITPQGKDDLTPVQRGLLRKPYVVLSESIPPLDEAEEDAKWPSVPRL